MGHNALFTYTIIIMMGNTWETALAATFISSILFLLITISGLTNTILDIIIIDLKLGIGAGIGFLLIFIGLQDCGIIVDDLSTLVSMGHLLSAPALLTLIGIFITIILYVQKIPSAIFIGLVLNTILGLIFTTLGFGTGNELMPSISPEIITTNIDTSLFLGFVRGFQGLFSNIHNIIIIIFSLVFLSFDTTGTFVSLGKQGGFNDENGKIKRVEKAFIGNAIAGMLSSIFGTSPPNHLFGKFRRDWNMRKDRFNCNCYRYFIFIIIVLCSHCIIIIYSFSDSCCLSPHWTFNDSAIKRGKLGR